MTSKYHELKLREQQASEIKMISERLANSVDTTENTTDGIGNRYRQEIGTDGEIHLILVESYNGELFE